MQNESTSFQGFITANQTPVTTPNRENILRFMIIYDAQPNGTTSNQGRD